MSWFFSPKRSVDEETKQWLEECFQWLIKEFGEEVIRETLVVLPTEEFFPDKFSADERDIRVLFNTVCEYMETDSRKFRLYFYENEVEKLRLKLPFYEGSNKSAAGFYSESGNRYVIGLQIGNHINPDNLIATMAHEIAHGRLLGERRISGEDENHEYLADLLTVIFGMGIFNANSAFNFDSSMHGWKASTEGYLTEEMFGYALAMFAYVRNETSPDWSKFLKTNVRHYFVNSLKYLLKTNDTELKQISRPENL